MITREDAITQSLQDHLRTQIFSVHGYPADKVRLLDAFSVDLMDDQYPDGLNETLVAAAFQFDNGGTPVEIGSALRLFLHTVDFLVFGHTATWGRNVAALVKEAFFTEEGALPLLDYSINTSPRLILEWLPIDDPAMEREVASFDPRPWNAHAWSVRLHIEDERMPSTNYVPA